jgi:hypothetical protein
MDFHQTSTVTRCTGLGEHTALEFMKITIEIVQKIKAKCKRKLSCSSFSAAVLRVFSVQSLFHRARAEASSATPK